MTNMIVLDVVIGLVFVYLLYSMLATILQELLATAFSFRSKILERAIFRMLEDGKLFNKRFGSLIALFKKQGQIEKSKSIASQFYNHPMIKYLGEDKYNSKPAYITKETFSKVMIDLLRADDLNLEEDITSLIKKTISDGKLPASGIKIDDETLRFIRSVWSEAQGNVTDFRKLLEKWFDDTMERCTGWYKKTTQYILLVIGLIISILFNVDSISIAGKLEKDPNLRNAVVQQADAFMKAHPDLYQERINDLNGNKKNYNTTVAASKKDSSKRNDTIVSKIILVKSDSIAREKSDSLINRGILLTKRADSLINGDIAKMNGLLGLGWGSICKKDTVKKDRIRNQQIASTNNGSQQNVKPGATQVKTENSKNEFWKTTDEWISRIIGWFITALAISLGAPFWFDLLGKLMQLRGSVSTADTSKAKAKAGNKTTTA